MVISAPPATAPPVTSLTASTVTAANPAPHGWTTHTVQPGDTLIGIAARYRTTVGAIAARNDIRDRALIVAGTRLSVPRTTAPTVERRRLHRGAGQHGARRAPRRHPRRHRRALRDPARLAAQGQPPERARVHPPRPADHGARWCRHGIRRPCRGHEQRQDHRLPGAGRRHPGLHRHPPPHLRGSHREGERHLDPGRDPPRPAAHGPRRRRQGHAHERPKLLDTFNGVTYPRAVAEAAARNRAILAKRSVPSRTETKALIVATARRHGVDPKLALAIAYQESGWNQRAVSPANAVGVMQVIPDSGRWASDLAGRRLDLLKTQDNITAGVVMLRALGRATREPRGDRRGLLPGPRRAAEERDVHRHQAVRPHRHGPAQDHVSTKGR